MRRLGLACLILGTLSVPAKAQPRYDINPANCGRQTSDSSLRLTKNSFEFHESSCLVAEHKIVSQSTSDLKLECSGEGESWTRQLRVEVLDNGALRLTDETGTTEYKSCN